MKRGRYKIIEGDALEVLRQMPERSVHMVCTSPPYWNLRSYLEADDPLKPLELGSEKTPDEYVAKLVEVFREVRRVLRDDGVCFLNMGDGFSSGNRKTYRSSASDNKGHRVQDDMPRPDMPFGLKEKDLIGTPWLLAFALRDDGWYWRGWLPWIKRSAMPESAKDRPNTSLEIVHLFSKKPRYFFDMEAVKRGTRPATIERDKHSRILENDGPQSVRHDHETVSSESGRNWRTADLWFESIDPPHGMTFLGDELVGIDWPPESHKEAHFATYPTRFAESFIAAGTSEKGCCPKCKKPWVRVVEKGRVTSRGGSESGIRPSGNPVTDFKGGAMNCGVFVARENITLGWRPGCECDAGEPVPCTVLDPFCGSGTTLQVAVWKGRNAIGIELNPEYIELARRRIKQPLEGKQKKTYNGKVGGFDLGNVDTIRKM